MGIPGKLMLIWEFADGSLEYEVKSNVDYSGYARMYTSGTLFYEFIWDSDGSGSVTMYDDGEAFYSDSWTVADL